MQSKVRERLREIYNMKNHEEIEKDNLTVYNELRMLEEQKIWTNH